MRVKKRSGRFRDETIDPHALTTALLETIALLWEKREPARRGPKPSLHLDAIVATAIEIADEEGLEALSMQRLAKRLGYTTMSLYRYVRAKTDLVDLMIEAAFGACPPADPASSWRDQLERWALAIGAGFLAHPWSLAATTRLRVIGPNELGWMNTGVRILTRAGLSGEEAFDALLVVVGHVRTVAQFSFPAVDGERALSGPLWVRAMQTILERHGDDFAELRDVILKAPRDEAGPLEEAFLFGLRCILDGLALRIASHGDASKK